MKFSILKWKQSANASISSVLAIKLSHENPRPTNFISTPARAFAQKQLPPKKWKEKTRQLRTEKKRNARYRKKNVRNKRAKKNKKTREEEKARRGRKREREREKVNARASICPVGARALAFWQWQGSPRAAPTTTKIARGVTNWRGAPARNGEGRQNLVIS